MVAKKRQKIKQKQKQKQTQRVNVNVKIDQSKRTSSVRPKTTVQRSGPQIVMTTAGSYFPQRVLESNNQYNQLASIMEKIVENERRYKSSKGSLDSLREKRLDKFEANTAKNALASVSSQYSDTDEADEEVVVPDQEDETDFLVPQETDSIIENDSIMEDTRTPIVDTEYEVIPQDAKVYAYPTRLPIDYFERYFNTETGRWNLDRNVSRQKNGYIQKELSERHYKKNI